MGDRLGQPSTTDELVVGRDAGVWAVRSTSPTVYYLDLGPGGRPRTLGHVAVLRSPGAGSSAGPWDRCWLDLVSVEDAEGQGRIRVGRRHRWTMDPGGSHPLIWWIQRAVTSIEPVAPRDHPAGREPDVDEASRPFGREAGAAHDLTPPRSEHDSGQGGRDER
jgi:hypothetical protein